jgi:hypothetical protein
MTDQKKPVVRNRKKPLGVAVIWELVFKTLTSTRDSGGSGGNVGGTSQSRTARGSGKSRLRSLVT